MRQIILLVGVGLAVGDVMTASAQRAPTADSAVSAALRRAGPQITAEAPLLAVLRNSGGAFSRSQQDAVAEALVSRVIANRAEYGSADSGGYNAAQRAVVALGHSGMARYTDAPVGDGGVPYSGALDRLIRIQQSSRVAMIRYEALRLILGQADRVRAIDYVQQVAESHDQSAYDAILVLINDAEGRTAIPAQTPDQRKQSLDVLRKLAANHAVKSQMAEERLSSWIRTQPR